jgi:hypothetical protein
MNRILFAMLLSAFTGVAIAQTVTVTKDTGETETLQTTTTTADTVRPESARTCLRSTGSRITAAQNLRADKDGKPQRCAPGPGRTYTKEDLDRTGYVDIADALRSLDTSIR